MSDQNCTAEGLLGLLKESAMAGMINPATARSRRTAAEQLLSQLSEEEALDLRLVDVDRLCSRFHKLQGTSIRPETLKLYNARLKASLTDYFSWLEDPDGFVSVGAEARTTRKRSDSNRSKMSSEERALEEIKLGVPQRPAEIIPIPIRDNRVVFVQNLPLDLTPAEAGKIGRVIAALAVNESEDGQ
jgi:hypothetical protein